MDFKAGKPKLIRKINRKLIIDVIREEQNCTQTYISKKTGISKQTVSKITANLIKEGLVLKTGTGKSTEEGGKKPVLFKFNPRSRYVIGVMITNKITAILTDLKSNIIMEKSIDTHYKTGHNRVMLSLLELLREIINESKIEKSRLSGVGIGIQGIVSDKRIKLLPSFMDWEDLSLGNYLEKEMGCRVFIENDNRLRGYGEKWFGLARNVNNFATLYIEKGLGAGFFYNNKTITGYNHYSGEIGHIKLKKDGPKCGCGGNGCLETMVNVERIRGLFREKIKSDSFNNSVLYRKFKNSWNLITPEILFDNFYKGDVLAKQIVDDISYWLGKGISLISATLDPDLIIIHGPYVTGGEYFLEKVKASANKNFLPNVKKEINIKYSKLGERAGLIGAVGIVLDHTL
ncbi:MAG: hypothetical protein A2Z35_03560 [Actinobacteria bacterium RBG_19FT_COMBO_36_27]|nr:MAG: hypothetical protein A2Z35_03560 [Actinobacteria bacterium RBG_19FT_COMBO_36_27]